MTNGIPILLALGLIMLTAACAGTDDGVAAAAGTSGIARNSSVAGSNSTGGAGGAALVVAVGASGTAGFAGGLAVGGAASLTPGELITATYHECPKGCSLVIEACPSESYDDCLETCLSRADSYFDYSKCRLAFYEFWACVTRTLRAADIRCAQGDAGMTTFNGCLEEQDRLLKCQ